MARTPAIMTGILAGAIRWFKMNKSIILVIGLVAVALLFFGCTQAANPQQNALSGAGTGDAVSHSSGAGIPNADPSIDAAIADNNSLADTSGIDSIDLPDFNGIE